MHTRAPQVLILLAGLVSGATQAVPPAQSPEVVYRGPDTVLTAPYRHNLKTSRRDANPPPDNPAPGPGVTPLDTRLPLRPDTLQPGAPSVRETTVPVTPFFVMGMDRHSLDWLVHGLATLLALNATGLVVQATNADDWQRLRDSAQASGLSLSLSPDRGLREAYGITHYPVLVVPQTRAARRATGEGRP